MNDQVAKTIADAHNSSIAAEREKTTDANVAFEESELLRTKDKEPQICDECSRKLEDGALYGDHAPRPSDGGLWTPEYVQSLCTLLLSGFDCDAISAAHNASIVAERERYNSLSATAGSLARVAVEELAAEREQREQAERLPFPARIGTLEEMEGDREREAEDVSDPGAILVSRELFQEMQRELTQFRDAKHRSTPFTGKKPIGPY